MNTEHTVVMQHLPRDVSELKMMTEICSGIGAVTEGYEACGATIKSHNEKNTVFAEWLRRQNKVVIQGDIADPGHCLTDFAVSRIHFVRWCFMSTLEHVRRPTAVS